MSLIDSWDLLASFLPTVYGNPLATLFTHYPIVWTVTSSVVNQSIGCDVAWVTKARLSIQSCGAVPQDLCRSLISSLPIGGESK